MAFILTKGNGGVNVVQDIEGPITAKAEQVRAKFQVLLDKTNKENPSPKDVKALFDLLSDNKRLELWRDVASAGYLAELIVVENARATPAGSNVPKPQYFGLFFCDADHQLGRYVLDQVVFGTLSSCQSHRTYQARRGFACSLFY